jgi:DNA invertase Pin-like site-specific DNA recombinase
MTITTQRIATEVAIRTAREYLRVSKGKGRKARSINDQHTDNLASEMDHGPWTWGEPYRDTGSASKYATRARDDFERLLADLTSGDFGIPGDVLVLWEISRLARETGRGVALIDACEARGYLIHITSEGETGRTYDPRNYADRFSLVTGIAEAENEARKLSARTLRGVNSAAREGRPHGRIPLGYARDYEMIDGRPRCVRQYPDPVNGPLIKELFERAAGDEETLPEPVYAIALDWKARGIRTPDRMVDGEHVSVPRRQPAGDADQARIRRPAPAQRPARPGAVGRVRADRVPGAVRPCAAAVRRPVPAHVPRHRRAARPDVHPAL